MGFSLSVILSLSKDQSGYGAFAALSLGPAKDYKKTGKIKARN
jgi:hypothetical protein